MAQVGGEIVPSTAVATAVWFSGTSLSTRLGASER